MAHTSINQATVAVSTKISFARASRHIIVRNVAGGTGAIYFSIDPAITAANVTMCKLEPGEHYEHNDVQPLDHLYYIGEGTAATIAVYAH